MLMNFCHHSVKPQIKSDKVCFDGYEVFNLISADSEALQRGFISDHFVKPPVNITVQFPCNIAIYRIIIDPVIGQQKSCDMKIFTATQSVTDSWVYGKDESSLNTDGVIFHFVGSVSQNEPAKVCFENRLFRKMALESEDNSKYSYKVDLNGRKPGSLTNVSHVTVCVFRTKGGKAVALRSLEVWGSPTSKVPNSVQCKLKNVYWESLHQQKLKSVVSKPKQNSDVSNSGISTSASKEHANVATEMIQNGIAIPEDFLDQITFEIMAVPVLLPSGKNVDELTLDKFISTESSWGRGPSDPFTGVEFSAASHPVTNSTLKARIDKFVLAHSDVLKVPRTLGSYKSDNEHQSKNFKSSRLLSTQEKCLVSANHPKGSNLVSPINSSADKTVTGPAWFSKKGDMLDNRCAVSAQNCSTAHGNKRKLKGEGELSTVCKTMSKRVKSGCTIASGLNTQDKVETSENAPAFTNVCSKMEPEEALKCHTANLSQSLESALSTALGGLPSFSRKTKASNSSKTDLDEKQTDCCKCKTSLQKSDTVKYRLPCNHVICRHCVKLTNGHTECNTCKCVCKSSEIVRIF